MKKIILIAIVCLLIPCFGIAQEPDSMFSIEGTLWSSQEFEFDGMLITLYAGFYDGDIYGAFTYGFYDLILFDYKHSYGDLGVVSYFFYLGETPLMPINPNCLTGGIGLLSPLGFGIVTQVDNCANPSLPPLPFMLPTLTVVMHKIEDNWDPTGWEGTY